MNGKNTKGIIGKCRNWMYELRGCEWGGEKIYVTLKKNIGQSTVEIRIQ
jgi:hypothetical protein